jgi:hypothetical protein
MTNPPLVPFPYCPGCGRLLAAEGATCGKPNCDRDPDVMVGRMFFNANAARLAFEDGDLEHARRMVLRACQVVAPQLTEPKSTGSALAPLTDERLAQIVRRYDGLTLELALEVQRLRASLAEKDRLCTELTAIAQRGEWKE